MIASLTPLTDQRPIPGPETPFDELKAWVGFEAEDSGHLRQLIPLVTPALPTIADRFYSRILCSANARRVFEDEAQVNRLKISLQAWILEVLDGPHDDRYYQRHLRIGRRHVEVGLPQQYMFTAMSCLRLDLMEVCASGLGPEHVPLTSRALMRILDIELAIMLESFVADTRTRDMTHLRDILMENLPIAAMLVDGAGVVTCATGALRAQLERPFRADSRARFDEVIDPALVSAARMDERIDEALRSRQPVQVPRLDVEIGGEKRSFRLTVVPLEHPQARILVHVEDLTAALLHEAQSRHAENLAQLGQMAAAIAHELRNPLAGFSATMQVLLGSLPETDRRRAIMGKVLEQIKRLDGLVSDLLQFARPVQAQCQDIDLRSLARRVASQVSLADIGSSHVVGKGSAHADGALLQQAVYNLMINAWQAGAGRVEVRIADNILDVVDDGPGIPDARAAEVFKPFVTSKTRGTGLGLPNARRFVEAMGGTVELTPSALGGAGFRVALLPARSASAGHASPSDSEEHIE